MKKRKRSCGAPSLLDSDDEKAIAKAIEEKSTAHGRRHDMVLYIQITASKRKTFYLWLIIIDLNKGKSLLKVQQQF